MELDPRKPLSQIHKSPADKILLAIILVVWIEASFVNHFAETERKIENFFAPVVRIVHSIGITP
jgi:hypothetical protein